jgi:hypothetical protein
LTNEGQEGRAGLFWGWIPVGGGRHKERVNEDECGWLYFVCLYEKKRMKPVEIVLRKGKERRGRTTEWVNLAKTCCKHLCKITMYPPVQLLYANKKQSRFGI